MQETAFTTFRYRSTLCLCYYIQLIEKRYRCFISDNKRKVKSLICSGSTEYFDTM